VAVLDTGIDTNHPDLAGQVVATTDFSGEGSGDSFGHGTHVASIIAGTAVGSGGRYKGVAPQASLLDGKVCTSDGTCQESEIIAGMQWATEQGARVVNLSLGHGDTAEVDPLEQAVNTLTAQTGALFVVAAGNDGPQAQTLGSPATADAALAVGAVDTTDQLAAFSSRGPRVGDDGLKPDLTGPGVDIVAARAEGTQMGEPVGEHYTTASGTSMATPHASGATALLAQQHPDWDAGQLKSALMSSAEPNPELGVFEQGAGRIDVAQVLGQRVLVEPASLSLGLQRWPHNDDEPVTKQLTYRNLGDEPLTLDLAATLQDPDGHEAPDGALRLSGSQISVPPHGTATVTVSADTSHDGRDGAYTGEVGAVAGDTRLTTPLTVVKEVESYDLTIRHINRHGEPVTDPADYFDWALGFDSGMWQWVYSDSGTASGCPKPSTSIRRRSTPIGGPRTPRSVISSGRASTLTATLSW
jgi:subtilisin family serine protease